jgi:ABC-2 type transport system permease protein
MIEVLTAEWTKIRTVRSTAWTLSLTVLFCVGLGYLVGLAFNSQFGHMPPGQQRDFDPLFASFYSLTFGQLPLVVFAALVVGGEYTSGMIRASLVAVPQRGLFYSGKVLVGTLVALAISLPTVIATFFAAQAALGPHGTSLTAGGAPQATIGACLYLTLICAFSLGVATMLRRPAVTLGILLPLFFLGSQGLGNVPKLKTVTQYLPDQAGMVIMHISGPSGSPRFGRDYGPWEGMGLLALWTATALLCGYLALRHRDA